MPFVVLTPLAASTADNMSNPPIAPANRLRLHGGTSEAAAARNSIISSSAKGWSPLQITKRGDGAMSPLKNGPSSPNPTSPQPNLLDSPRRTSNSFKHVTRNSLVANSPFKNLNTVQGAQAAGMEVSAKGKEVIHERRAAGASRSLGQTLPSAAGSASTPKAAIGLGISAKPKSSGSAVAGTRKVSMERGKATIPSSSGDRRVSGGSDRRTSGGSVDKQGSGSKENDSPNVRGGKSIPRQSSGFKGLKEQNFVTRSPFVASRRIPSGDLSPSPSPKTVPASRQATPGSPSPRRTSGGQRKVSPAQQTRSSPSLSPSPTRHFSHSHSLVAGPSPLGKSANYLEDSPTPAAPLSGGVPKSAMTPSRRLLGPRHHGINESPSKQAKTVTFQSVPDVKEFERLSEGTPDASFDFEGESGDEHDRDWVDDVIEAAADSTSGEHDDNSLDEILPPTSGITVSGNAIEDRMGRMTLNREHNTPDASPNPNHHESTTADFMDTLIEEGLFTPVVDHTPTLADQPMLVVEEATPQSELTSETENEEDAPYLSTPSLGTDEHFSASFGEITIDDAAVRKELEERRAKETEKRKEIERDSAGIPYGRTHHTERATLAHSLPPLSSVSPIIHPNLPTNSDHHMLFNANAAQPALPVTSPVKPITRMAHQIEPLHDPFITIQTATAVLSPLKKAREEGGVPLGRTSHAERINVARTLATQQLGLGMPRSPGLSSTRHEAEDKHDGGASESGSEVDSGSEDDERFFSSAPRKQVSTPLAVRKASKQEEKQLEDNERVNDWRAGVEETPKRGLPKPPQPQEVDLPSPVKTPARASATQEATEKRSSKLDFSGFALPVINMTSPFFRQTATMEKQVRIPSNEVSEQSTEDDDKPLTPPPQFSRSPKEDSPHRIPSFEFEEIKLTSEEMLVQRATVSRNPHSPIKATFVALQRDKEEEEQLMMEMRRANPGLVLSPKRQSAVPVSQTQGETQSRVRQRISREMIRETIDRKYADGSISRRPTSAAPTLSTSQDSQISETSKRNSVMGGKYTTSVAPPSLTSPTSATKSIPIVRIGTAPAPLPSPVGSSFGKDKDLPPPPASTPMLKASSEIPHSTIPEDGGRPSRPRSNTQAVPLPADAIRSAAYHPDSSPKSGLDHIIAGNLPRSGSRMTGYSPSAHPGLAPILQKSVPSGTPERGSSRMGAISPISGKAPRPYSVLGQFDGSAMASSSLFAVTAGDQELGKKIADRNVSGGQGGSRRSRRSMSMSDVVEEVQPSAATRKQPRLTLGLGDQKQSITEAIEDELSTIDGDRKYRVRERHVPSASFGNTVSHSKAGDIDGGRAWRQLRRPSDINEHAKEIREMRDRSVSTGKTTGTIFVKVLGIESLVVPVPREETFFCVTLDNGIDYIRTPYTVFEEGARVNQEFALVEHPNFEFSLSLDIRRDPHIIRALQEQTHQMVAQRQPSLTVTHGKQPSSSGGGIRNLFSSPRKAKPSAPPPQQRSTTPLPFQPPAPPKNTIARYFATSNSSTIAKTHVAFKPIAKQCEARVLEIRYPMFAMFKGEPDRPREGDRGVAPPGTPRKQVGKITLQIFRLPPLPGVKLDDMPQCIDECLSGMRKHAWHECEYHEGVLTQSGGDLKTNHRRRTFKLIGGNLIAYNEITRKEVTSIDLREAISITDLNPDMAKMSPTSRITKIDEDGLFGARPRSFRIDFRGAPPITFSADKDEDKEIWMETLNGLIGKIPANPLWAELLAEKQREKAKDRTERHGARSASRSTMHSSAGHNQPNPYGPVRPQTSYSQHSAYQQPWKSDHSHIQSHDQIQSSHQHHPTSGGQGNAQGRSEGGRKRETSEAMSKARSAPGRAPPSGSGQEQVQAQRPAHERSMSTQVGGTGTRMDMGVRKGEGIV